MGLLFMENRDRGKGGGHGDNSEGQSALKTEFQCKVPQSMALTV